MLLESVPFLEEETEYDILNLQRFAKHITFLTLLIFIKFFLHSESLPPVDYLLVQHPADHLQSSPGGLAIQSSIVANTASGTSNANQTTKIPIMV